jgi:hypothetical protein
LDIDKMAVSLAVHKGSMAEQLDIWIGIGSIDWIMEQEREKQQPIVENGLWTSKDR